MISIVKYLFEITMNDPGVKKQLTQISYGYGGGDSKSHDFRERANKLVNPSPTKPNYGDRKNLIDNAELRNLATKPIISGGKMIKGFQPFTNHPVIKSIGRNLRKK